MDIRVNGVAVSINLSEQSNECLLGVAQEIADVARERGLEIPAFAGSVAVESTSEGRVEPANVKEALVGQFNTAFKGYLSQVDQINKNREHVDKIETVDIETLTTEFETWFTEDRQAYVAEAIGADPELSFTLCAVPNVTVTVEEILKDAQDFGKNQPIETTIYPEVITCYTPEEVSGTNPKNGNKFKIVLVPSKFTPELPYHSFYVQRARLAELQKKAPFLEAPTPLVGMTHLHTRRALGDKLFGEGTVNKTYTRCYNMEDKPSDGRRCVPYLVVNDSGQLSVDSSTDRIAHSVFALVG